MEYDNAVSSEGAVSSLLFPATMDFNVNVAASEYGCSELEPDLQKSVDAIKSADTLAVFTSYKPDSNPIFPGFINRLFHLRSGEINYSIWGRNFDASKRVRIITVIDDHDTWRKYKFRRDASQLPIHKIDFRVFGFEQVYTSTFGYLQDNVMNEYGLKQVAKMHRFAFTDVSGNKE